MLKLVLLGINVLFVAGQCPTGWNMHGNSCYFFSHDAESWPAAMEQCMSDMFMADLVSVDDAAEQQFILNRMANISSKAVYWLGANDIINEGTWVLGSSKTAATFTSWLPGEPNNVKGGENCAILVQIPGWYDIECNSKVPYICERPAQ